MTTLAWFAVVALLQQTPAARDMPATPITGTAVIAGTVVTDEPTPRPLRRAVVTISAAQLRASQQVVTDDAGRFAFASLPAGRYTLTAAKAAYVKAYYGAKRPGRPPGTPIAVGEGQRITDLSIKLVRGAVITGVVRDERGIPLASAQVMTFEPVIVNGRRKLVDINGALQWATTDERGIYRLYGLAPGEYTVRASAGASLSGGVQETTASEVQAALRELQSPQTTAPSPSAAATSIPAAVPQIARQFRFYPSADSATAEVFALGAGEERANVDVVLPIVRTSSFEGMSVGPGGQPIVDAMISILFEGTLWASPGILRPKPDGRFSLSGFQPGQYTLIGRTTVPAAPAAGSSDATLLWAETTFELAGADVTGIVLQFAPGTSVSGRIGFQGSVAPPDVTKLRLSLTPVDAVPGSLVGFAPSATHQPDGSFTIAGVAPGKYRVVAAATPGWSLRSALLNGRDTLDAPFDVAMNQPVSGLAVTFTDQVSELSGILLDQLGRPTPEYTILVFSTDRAHWIDAPRRMSGAVKLGSDGAYKVTGLPPGDYYVCAVADIDARQLTDPSVLEALIPAAIKVTIADGEKKRQDLRIGGR